MMGRMPGAQMRRMLASSQQLGPATARGIAIHADMPHIDRSWTSLCDRAVALGLMSVVYPTMPRIYKTPRNWRDILNSLNDRRRRRALKRAQQQSTTSTQPEAAKS